MIKNALDRYLKELREKLVGEPDSRMDSIVEHAFMFGATATFNALANKIKQGPHAGVFAMASMEGELRKWNKGAHQVWASAQNVKRECRVTGCGKEICEQSSVLCAEHL